MIENSEISAMERSHDGFRYSVYGMHLHSEVRLPELKLLPDASIEHADVAIKFGSVPDQIVASAPSTSWIEGNEERCLIKVPGVAKFLAEQGHRITVEKEDQASYSDVRGFLLGSGLAAILHQRGMVPLHVSATLSPEGIIAFTGDSGAGKSTMVAHLHQMTGWGLVSDDVSALHRTDQGFFLESGVNTVKLWKDALASLNRTSDGLKRDLTRFDKFHAIEPSKFLVGKFPLKRLICLEWGESLDIRPVTGRRAFEIAMGAVYRPEFATICGNRETVVQGAMALASKIEIRLLTRPKSDVVASGVEESIRHAILSDLDAML
ncbi:MAG: hypothetical protein AAFW60_02695 [Pseudomonadota bacterium]